MYALIKRPMRLLFFTLLVCCVYPCRSAVTNSIASDSPVDSTGIEPAVPYIVTVPTEYVKEERYPSDRWITGDPAYAEYIAAKKYPAGQSAFVQQLTRKLSRPDFTKTNAASLQKWLKLKDASVWDAVRILESPNFDGSQLEYLNELPHFYLKQRMLVPFKAFLKRFKYGSERESLFTDSTETDDNENNSEAKFQSTPFTVLAFSFLKPEHLDDPTVDSFFACLFETQPEAFETCEWMFFDSWIRSGTHAWRYLRLYFENSHSPTKSHSLVSLLTASNYSGPITSDLMKFIVSFESFDPNIRVHYFDNGPDPEKSAFFHILVLDPKYSTTFLPQVLKCKSLDTSMPTGTVVLSFKACNIIYVNQPILFLAGALGNGWALFHLSTDERIADSTRIRDFLLFLFVHFFKILHLSLLAILTELYAKVRRTTP